MTSEDLDSLGARAPSCGSQADCQPSSRATVFAYTGPSPAEGYVGFVNLTRTDAGIRFTARTESAAAPVGFCDVPADAAERLLLGALASLGRQHAHTASDAQFERLMDSIEAEKRASADEMPTEHDALRVLQQARARLGALGWRDAIYCPKDGTVFEVVEAGSTGLHDCVYQGEWPNGSWWVLDAGDMWPSRPILFRLKALAREGKQSASEPPQKDNGQ